MHVQNNKWKEIKSIFGDRNLVNLPRLKFGTFCAEDSYNAKTTKPRNRLLIQKGQHMINNTRIKR
uniref:Uncharacterized protein n=1 Tax=Romanomermis culicivorax TaxID=13658 RepID=A0A915ITL3_ROMCU